MAGDALSSFVKRRLGRRSGAEAPLVDQLPEALLPLLVFQERLGLGLPELAATVLLFTGADLGATRIRANRERLR
jgi:CDP-2,3-bis-(O-geranylgeranyl)-sn-glycerol synthase